MCRCICCRWRCVLRWLSRWVGLLVVPVVLVAMYAALLPASLYALAALRLARERGALEKGEARLHTLQLFVPGLDIIAVMELHARLHPPAEEEN